jgi:hypothetical protein
MQVPAFLLRRLYVRGSLRNVADGFEFDLLNSLGSGYAERALPLLVNGVELPLQDVRFVVQGNVMPFAEVSPERPMTLGLHKKVTVAATGAPLAAGKHRLGIGFVVVGMGEMQFEVTDAIDARKDGDDAA